MRVGIALGSNVGDRAAALRMGRAAVFGMPGVVGPFASSRIYETDPVDTDPDSGAFLNAAIEIGYAGTPAELLAALQAIEREMGRPSKRPKNAPRRIDLDILYFGDVVLCSDDIEIPHPRLHLRRFVLAPLADIAPDLILPGQNRTIAALLADLRDPAGVKLSAETWKP